ncbi:MAG: tryptophan synthase subunit alpha [Candidatus Omnitrophota bacterium]
MNRIDKKFKELKERGKKAFIVYITVGDPSLKMTERLVLELERSGVDIIELGVPFSDPLADGPTIQNAALRALKKGVTMADAMRLVRSIRKRSGIPIAFMTYYNPVLQYGLKRFARDCKAFGVDGVIVPDLPYEEADELRKYSKQAGMSMVYLLAPTSTPARIQAIGKASTGFVYYVSVTGVTGARKKMPKELVAALRKIRSKVNKPLCVGFGVSQPRQARQIARAADGVIVGSALISLIEKSSKNDELVKKVSGFAKRLATTVHSV